jgi:hypothetical protein
VGFGFGYDNGLLGRYRTYQTLEFIMMKRIGVLCCVVAFSVLAFVGCPEKPSAEKAAKEAGKLLEQAGRALDDAARDASKAVQGAAKEAGQNAQNAADDALKNVGK